MRSRTGRGGPGRPAAAIALAVLAVLIACSDDDEGASLVRHTPEEVAPPTSLAVTVGTGGAPPAPDPSRPECLDLVVVLKLDATDRQRGAVEAALRAAPDVASFTFDEPAPQSQEAPTFHVRPVAPEKLEAIGTQLALPGVSSVVYPRQRC